MAMPKYIIKEHLYNGANKDYSHMIVVLDRFEYEDLIVYVKKEENLEKVLERYQGIASLYQVIEIYSYDLDLESQLNEERAWHKEIKAISNNNLRPMQALNCIPFKELEKLVSNVNGYIDQNGNFYPTISSAEVLVSYFANDQKALEMYRKKRQLVQSDEEFLINVLGFAKFYRSINYEVIDASIIPGNCSIKQLIVLKHLFSINYSDKKEIVEKDNQYTIKLSNMMGE